MVVGGRIAGCLTALRLVEQGVSVRVLESHAYPSGTLSTHFFRGDGLVRSLQEVGVLDEILSTGAPPLGCEYLSVDGGPFEQGGPQEPGAIGYCLSVRRSTLDAILARRAGAAGVDVRPQTRVVDLGFGDEAVIGVIDQEGASHRAKVVVGADGRRSTVARLVAASEQERHARQPGRRSPSSRRSWPGQGRRCIRGYGVSAPMGATHRPRDWRPTSDNCWTLAQTLYDLDDRQPLGIDEDRFGG